MASEQAMWSSISAVDDLLDNIDDEDVKMHFLREQHEALYGPHYDETFSDYDVSRPQWRDANGVAHSGAHWTRDQVKTALSNKQMPQGTTACDMWVAANVMYSDLLRDFDESQILKATYSFFFADDDAPEGKIWHYVEAMQQKE